MISVRSSLPTTLLPFAPPHRTAGAVYDRSAVVAAAMVVSLATFGCSVPEPAVYRLEGTTMGTTYQVTYAPAAGSGKEVQSVIDSLLEEINQSLSTYIDTSAISQINAATDNETWHQVDAHFEAIFVRSQEIHQDTDGAFNPAVGPLVNAWGFGPEGPQELPDSETIDALLGLTSFEAFEWQSSPPAVRKQMPGAQLDFSAIAKGYGVDQVGRMLEEDGVSSYFIEIGGEVLTRGMHPEGRPWRVGIERPDEAGDIQAVLAVNDSALATSGNYRNYNIDNGERITHILNPASGRPETSSLLSASVLAPDTMTADAYATAFMVMGLDSAMDFVEAREELEGYFVSAGTDGTFVESRSSGFPNPE